MKKTPSQAEESLSLSYISLFELKMANFLKSEWNAGLITSVSKLQDIESIQPSLRIIYLQCDKNMLDLETVLCKV